ncbi:hypothetical protein QJS10_CPA06g00758 [Acorus calamus]|uniref:Uncharacterized protein n=1 Tax=Acorus calamus TaxID=4465 RepID=A0AAV9EKY1_ACOCL|nr:hypothetical protein QJS10_CPA06g00758 [Acorus calamus]
MKYEKDGYARIGVMPRYGDSESVVWFNVQPHCIFHILNCSEEGEEVVVRGFRQLEAIIPGPDLVEKAPPTTPLQHLTSSLNSAFKPLLKETNQLTLKTQVTESIKAACVTMLDAFVDSTFKFVDTPAELPGNYAPVDEIDEAIMLSDIEGEIPDFPQLRFGKVTKDYNNTNVFEHAGKVYTISENHLPYEIDKSNLKTGKIWDVNGVWDRPFTSHPKRAPGTGERVIMGVNAVKPYYVGGVISADAEKLLNKVNVKFETPTLSHKIGITENYNIILDYPIRFGLNRLLADKQLIGYERDDGQRSRIGVMPRYGDAKSIKWFGVKNHCSYHIINSFEDGNEVVKSGLTSTKAKTLSHPGSAQVNPGPGRLP